MTIFVLAFTCADLHMDAQQKLCLSLDDMFALAETNSREIRVSMSGHEVAEEEVLMAKSQRLPDVNLSVGGSYIGTATMLSRGFSSGGSTTVPYAIGAGTVNNGAQPTPHWGNDFVAQVTQVVYAGGGISAAVKLAEQGSELAKLDIDKKRQDVRFILAGHYLEMCKLNNMIEVVKTNVGLAEQVLRDMRVRYEQGTLLKTDITRYELQLHQLLLTETELKDAASIVNHQLVTTLRLPADVTICPVDMQEYGGGQELQQWHMLAQRENVGIKQMQLLADMETTGVKAARASLLPSVAIVAEDRLAGPYVNDLIPVDANINAWFVGISVKYDLGNLWRKNHDVRRARVKAMQSRQQVELVQENIDKAVQADYVNVQTAMTAIDTQRKQVELAEEHYRVTKSRYDSGLALLTDMLDASNMKLSADMELVNAQIKLLYNFYKLKYSTSTL